MFICSYCMRSTRDSQNGCASVVFIGMFQVNSSETFSVELSKTSSSSVVFVREFPTKDDMLINVRNTDKRL